MKDIFSTESKFCRSRGKEERCFSSSIMVYVKERERIKKEARMMALVDY